MKTLIVLGIIIVAGLVWMAWEIKHAPEGYEDETGFHVGKAPKDEV